MERYLSSRIDINSRTLSFNYGIRATSTEYIRRSSHGWTCFCDVISCKKGQMGQ